MAVPGEHDRRGDEYRGVRARNHADAQGQRELVDVAAAEHHQHDDGEERGEPREPAGAVIGVVAPVAMSTE